MNLRQIPLRGLLLGAAAMYYLDPQLGRRRRAMLFDKGIKLKRRTSKAMLSAMHGVANRAGGALCELGRRLVQVEPDDAKLVARIHSGLGRITPNSRAIGVVVDHGAATLAGEILANERHSIVDFAETVPGISRVIDRLVSRAVEEPPDELLAS